MSSQIMSPPDGGDVDRGPAMLGIFWTETALSIVIVASRFYSRYVIKGIGSDDWAMLSTLITLILFVGFETAYALAGGGRHLYYLEQDPTQAMRVLKLNWLSQPFAIMSLALGKISVAFLMLRLLGPFVKIRKIFLWVLIVLTFVFSIVCCILTFVQCNPVEGLWDPSVDAVCWDPRIQDDFSLFLGAWNAAADLVLAVLPISIIYNIKISKNKKIGLCSLLGLGILASVCAGVKTAQLSSLLGRDDFTWNTFDLLIWTSTETFLLIFCGSASTMRPLLDVIRGRNPIHSYKYGTGSGRGHHPRNPSNSQKHETSKQLGAHRASKHETVVTSEATSEEWPLSSIKGAESGIQHTVEFNVIHERTAPNSISDKSADGGFGASGFHVV